MKISKSERNELDTLSKKIYGSSSHWRKLIERGYPELVTGEVEEEVPSDNKNEPFTKRIVKKPIFTKTGSKQFVQKRHTLTSIKELMLEQR